MGCCSSKAEEGSKLFGPPQTSKDRQAVFAIYQAAKRLRAFEQKHMPSDCFVAPKKDELLLLPTATSSRVGVCTLSGATSKATVKQPPNLFAKQNQDFALFTTPLGGRDDAMLVGVYDGHGISGEIMSRRSACEVARVVARDLKEEPSKPRGEVLTDAIAATETILKDDMPKVAYENGGTTAAIVLLEVDTINLAWVGDARAVVGGATAGDDAWVVSQATADHKPSNTAERERIEASGGVVREIQLTGPSGGSLYRVAKLGDPVNTGIAIARSLGDGEWKAVGVSAEPSTLSMSRTADERCIIVASDGLWEFVSNEEAVAICYANRGDASQAARALVLESVARFRYESEAYRDDITAAVLFLPMDAEPPAAPDPPSDAVEPEEYEALGITWGDKIYEADWDRLTQQISASINSTALEEAPAELSKLAGVDKGGRGSIIMNNSSLDA